MNRRGVVHFKKTVVTIRTAEKGKDEATSHSRHTDRRPVVTKKEKENVV